MKANEKNCFVFKIKSKYILKQIFDNLSTIKLLEIVRYNQQIKRKLDINKKDYIKTFSKIIIEIEPKENVFATFINIKDKDDSYFHIYFNDNKEEVQRTYIIQNEKISKIKIIIDYEIKSLAKLFKDCKCIKSINFVRFDFKNISNMSYMFYGCSSLEKLNISNFITNNVTSMKDMFSKCSSLKKLEISNFNTNKLINMSWMFFKCKTLTSLNLSNFNTDKVTNMSSLFSGCNSLKELDLSNFNTEKVKDMSWMFYNCSSLQYLNISNFSLKYGVNKSYMFINCKPDKIDCSPELKKKILNKIVDSLSD